MQESSARLCHSDTQITPKYTTDWLFTEWEETSDEGGMKNAKITQSFNDWPVGSYSFS